MVTAIEPSADGRPRIRLVNASAPERAVRVRWNGRETRLERVDLRGQRRPDGELPPDPGGGATLPLRSWEIAALRPVDRP